jgi:putative transposase
MPRSRYRFGDPHQPHFLTSTIVAWLAVFTRPDTVQILLDSWTFLHKEGRIVLYGYVVLENHIHWIASAEDLGKQVGNFKSYTARRIIDLLELQRVTTLLDQLQLYKLRHKIDQEHQLWQESSHPEAIDGDEMMVQKLEYTHMNPVKRGYVDDPLHWRYSSARNYAGQPGLIEVRTRW